jgi:hypothetical protein
MRRIFWGFCRNWFLIDPLHYFSSRSDFGFEFADIRNQKTTPRLGESASPNRRVGESVTIQLGKSWSHYGESGSRYLNCVHLVTSSSSKIELEVFPIFILSFLSYWI